MAAYPIPGHSQGGASDWSAVDRALHVEGRGDPAKIAETIHAALASLARGLRSALDKMKLKSAAS